MTYVVSLELDPDSFQWLNELRKRHFPANRNFLDAHLTLFHKLDNESAAIVAEQVNSHNTDIALSFDSLRSLGNGVAVQVSAPELVELRAGLAVALRNRLTPQDAQGFRPHVTIQNKVDAADARALLDQLRATFVPRIGRGTAVLIWEYLQGPWKLRDRLAFQNQQ